MSVVLSSPRLARARLALLSSLAWLAAACGGSTLASDPGAAAGTTAGDAPIAGTTTPPQGNTTVPPPVTGTLTLQAQTPPQVFVNTGDSVQIELRYIADGVRPMANARLSFELLDQNRMPAPAGVSGTNLSALNTVTNEIGVAAVSIIAGQVPATLYVRAFDPANPTTAPLTWDVVVGYAGQGSLSFQVRYQTPGRYSYNNFATAKVTLFQESVSCDLIRQSAPQLNGAYLALNEIRPFNDITNTVSAPGVDSGERLNAAAIIYGTNGAPLTFGCVPSVQVQDGRSTTVEIVTADLPMTFKGTYVALHRFDMIDALVQSGGALGTVGRVFDLLRTLGGSDAEVGGEVIEQLCDLINIDDGICSLVRTVGASVVGQAINSNLPPQLRSTLEIIGDTLQIVGDLTIVGELEFTNNPNPMGQLITNDNRWNKMRFDWNHNCYAPSCEREVTFQQLGTRSRAVAGVFDAQVENNGTVSILEHPFTLGYGAIVMGLLETWIIPLALNPNGGGAEVGLEELLDTLLPCEDIQAAVGLDRNSSLCHDILVVALAEIVRSQGERLNFTGDTLKMRGSFKPVDENNDLTVDKLNEGRWLGHINVGDGVDFNGCFTACRGMECATPVCQITPAP